MFYGEGHTADASSGINRASLNGQSEMKGAIEGGASASPSIALVGELASVARKMGSERADAVEHLASRATSIATRIVGSYPFGAPKDPRQDGDRAEPRSALDALTREVTSIREPLARMDPAIGELSAALDVLERAIG